MAYRRRRVSMATTAEAMSAATRPPARMIQATDWARDPPSQPFAEVIKSQRSAPTFTTRLSTMPDGESLEVVVSRSSAGSGVGDA